MAHPGDTQRATAGQGPFKVYEVNANGIVLLIVLSLWEGGVFTQFLWPKCSLSFQSILGGGKNYDVLGALAAKVARGTSAPEGVFAASDQALLQPSANDDAPQPPSTLILLRCITLHGRPGLSL